MPILHKTFLLACFSLFSVRMLAQKDFCNVKNTSFKDNELLTFRVYYNLGFVWIPAGTAHFTAKPEEVNGRRVFHILGDGKTARSYVFFKVNDLYETYIDKETLLPHRFVRNVNEGGFRINQDIAFNHKKLQATSKDRTYDIPKCTQDVLSAIYFARNINYNEFRPGDKIPFNMFLDDKVYPLYIKYLGKEVVKTKMGTFKAIKIAPLLIEGTIFTGGEKMTIWVSDDSNHIPLRVDSPILVGSIKADLVGFENLRGKFTALINRDITDDRLK